VVLHLVDHTKVAHAVAVAVATVVTDRNVPQSPSLLENCVELQGHVFDCSDCKQADAFVSALKRIADHVGAKHRNGGDIRSSIINETKFVVPMPTETPIADPLKPAAEEQVARMTFKGQLEVFVKRTATLEDNIQKTCSLVIGQCADLLQSKLKQQAQ
jgi:hypothetical protein